MWLPEDLLMDDEIGAAAVCPLMQQTCSVHMGSDALPTVYVAEPQGISLAPQMGHEYADGNSEREKIAIYTDNQTAISSIAKAEGRVKAEGVLVVEDRTYSAALKEFGARTNRKKLKKP
jgi:hypothetical protein